MRFYLLVVMLFVAVGVQGQHKVTYLKKAHFPNGVVHEEISALYFLPDLVYEESTYLDEYFGSILDARSQSMNFIKFDGSLVSISRENLKDGGKKKREVVDEQVRILGISCNTLVQEENGYKGKTYFSEKYTFDYSDFSFAENYTNRFDEMGGAIPLGYDYSFEGVSYTLRAIEIGEISKEESKWLRSADRHTQRLTKLEEDFAALKKDYYKNNGAESEDFAFSGNIEARGHIKVEKLKVPITLNFTAPDLCLVEANMMGMTMWISTGTNLGWQYFEATDVFTPKKERERDNFGLVLEQLSFPEPDTVLAYFESEDKAYMTYLQGGVKQKAVIDLTTSFLLDSYMNDEKMHLETFEKVGEMWLPTNITMDVSEMKLAFVFDSFELSEALDESFFDIPDSLRSRLEIAPPPPSSEENSSKSTFSMAEEKMEAGEYAEAVELYRRALKDDPDSPLIFNQIGFCELQMEDYYGAIANFGRAIDIDNDYVVAHANLAYVKDILGDSQEAIRSYTDAINLNPKAEYYSKRGIVKYNIEQYQEALEDFKLAVAADSTRRDDWFNIAATLYEMEAYAEAIPHYTKAIDMQPTGRAYNDRGTSQYALEQYEFALNDFEKAVEISPTVNIYRNNLGDAYGALNRHKEAIEQYQIVAENDTTNAFIHYDLGQAYMGLDDAEAAINHYSKAIVLADDEAVFYDARGAAYLETMDYVAAIEDFSSSLTLYPDDGHIYYLRGMTKIYSSDIFDGCKDLNKAKSLGSDKASTLMEEKLQVLHSRWQIVSII